MIERSTVQAVLPWRTRVGNAQHRHQFNGDPSAGDISLIEHKAPHVNGSLLVRTPIHMAICLYINIYTNQ